MPSLPESIQEPGAPDLSSATDQVQALEAHISERTQILTEEQRKMLSKALFPESHTDKVSLLKKERFITPLPIKISRKISTLLSDFQAKVEGAEVSTNAVDLDLLTYLLEISKTLAEFYKWEDVLEALQTEDLTVTELQHLIVQQLNLQETNDFLLIPLRVLVGIMQQAEIEMVNMQSIFSGQV